jgi:hypothetical protein
VKTASAGEYEGGIAAASVRRNAANVKAGQRILGHAGHFVIIFGYLLGT